MSYIVILNLGVLTVVAIRGWRFLIPLALIGTASYTSIAFGTNEWICKKAICL
jgi:hypothetical protein